MLRNKRGFTLLETLLALALSSFIMLALTQAYRTLVTYIDRARDMALMNQRIALVTQVIERDLSGCCMPQLHPEIEPNKEKKASDAQPVEEQAPPAVLKPEEEKQKAEKRLEDRKKYFFTEINDADLHKVRGKRVELLKSCNFITTSVLEVYGESMPRWVRVRYELIPNKKAKQPEFTLVRKQTTDIHNVKMKISEVDPTAASKDHPIMVHEIAHGVKGFYIEFSMKKMPEKNEKGESKKAEPEEVKAFNWGESKKTMGEMPQRAKMLLELWNANRDRSDLIELEILMSAEGDADQVLEAAKKLQKKAREGSLFGEGSALGRLAGKFGLPGASTDAPLASRQTGRQRGGPAGQDQLSPAPTQPSSPNAQPGGGVSGGKAGEDELASIKDALGL